MQTPEVPEDAVRSEAEFIALLAPLAAGAPGAFGLRDDCALLTPRPGYDLVLKTDPIRSGIHFFADDPPQDIAWKALAVNVSDLAAKGAQPIAYLMALSFPVPPARSWVERFSAGLATAQAEFGCYLVGGDTDRAPGAMTIAITAIGEIPSASMVRRGTARVGDGIYVSGTIGDAALGLRLHQDARNGHRDLADHWGLDDPAVATLISRYLRPQPRLDLAPTIQSYATAAMDISDGLIKDLGRMCLASTVGAVIDIDSVPISAPAARVVASAPGTLRQLVTAGDDYELLAAICPTRATQLPAMTLTRIGTFVQEPGVIVKRADGSTLVLDRPGWDHF